MPKDLALADYYAQRAHEYERIYQKPERQVDLSRLRPTVATFLSGLSVYEIASGTGYWTEVAASTAVRIFAVDCNEEVQAIARKKPLSPAKTTFALGDAFAPPAPPFSCNAGLAAFWWSHLLLREIDPFLSAFFARLEPGARFVFLDNRFVPGSSTALTRSDEAGNTYQQRPLDSGASHEVLKNFPTEAFARQCLAPHARLVEWYQLDHYWLITGLTLS
jgi:SAM-dependent methyltransferase